MTSTTARPLLADETTSPHNRRGLDRANLLGISIIWMSNLVVVALWVNGNGLHDLFTSPAAATSSIGRITGLIAANLLLFQVLLMARVPVLERAFGHDTLTRMHRSAGFWSFWLMLAHIILITIGNAASAAVNPFVQLWTFIWTYPGMLLATVGTLLIIGVVAVSLARIRHRMRYESWHLLHLYAYLGVGLALPHQLWTGTDFSSGASRVYWWGMWLLALCCCLWYRVWVPIWRSYRTQLRVETVRAEGSQGVTVQMQGRRLHLLGAKPGQFFVWRFLQGSGWTRGHPFSLSAAPTDCRLQISARINGDGTRALVDLRPGTRVLIEGPYGGLTGQRRSHRKLLMFAAGAGITPVAALLESEPYAPGEAVLITRNRTEEQMMLGSDINTLVSQRGLVHYALPGHHSSGSSPWLSAQYSAWDGAEVIQRLVGDLSDYDIYICGPKAWMAAVTRDLRRAGAAKSQINQEDFAI